MCETYPHMQNQLRTRKLSIIGGGESPYMRSRLRVLDVSLQGSPNDELGALAVGHHPEAIAAKLLFGTLGLPLFTPTYTVHSFW